MEHFGTVSIVNIFNRQFNCSLNKGVPLRVRLCAHTAQALNTMAGIRFHPSRGLYAVSEPGLKDAPDFIAQSHPPVMASASAAISKLCKSIMFVRCVATRMAGC
jgi:hypothetical protein